MIAAAPSYWTRVKNSDIGLYYTQQDGKGIGGRSEEGVYFARQSDGFRFALFLFLFLIGRQLGVDLGGGDVGMAQQLLHFAQVGAVGQTVGGETVAQGVGGDFSA